MNGFNGDITTIRNFMTDLVEHVAPYFTSVYSNTELAEALDFHRRYTNTNEYEDEADNDGEGTARWNMEQRIRRLVELAGEEAEVGTNTEGSAKFVLMAAVGMLKFDYVQGMHDVLRYTAEAAAASEEGRQWNSAGTAERRWQVLHLFRTIDYTGRRIQL